jgi:arylsulfatase A-like enzyme
LHLSLAVVVTLLSAPNLRRPDAALNQALEAHHAELRTDAMDLAFLASDPLFTRRGWSALEASALGNRSWVSAREARLLLPFHSTSDKELRFRARSHEDLGPELDLELALNGHVLPTLGLTPQERKLRVLLPSSFQVRGTNVLSFRVSSLRRARPGEADQRPLAVAVSDLAVVPVDSVAQLSMPRAERSDWLWLPPSSSGAYYLRVPERARLILDARPRDGGGTPPLIAVSVENDASGRAFLQAHTVAKELRTEIDLAPYGGEILRLELANESVAAGAWVAASLDVPKLVSPRLSVTWAGSSPHVFLFVVDTLRADALGAYGKSPSISPHFDALAKQGVLFEDATSQASWTRPAVASLLTGVAPATHGPAQEDQGLRPEITTLAERLRAAGYRTGAFVANHLLTPDLGYARGFDTWNEERTSLYGARAETVVERALAWLERAETPAFLYIHVMEPHAPYDSTPGTSPAACSGECDTLALLRRGQLGELPEEKLQFLKARYEGEVHQADQAFGSLSASLKRRSVFDQSIIVFTADHGEEFREHKGTGHAKTLYQEVIRVPLAFRLPRATGGGGRIAGPVEHLDLMPTLLALVGAAEGSGLSGRNLTDALLEGRVRDPAPPLIVSEARFTTTHKYSARSGRWKLIENADGPLLWRAGAHTELYDLASDPLEQVNIVDRRPIVARFLLQRIRAYRQAASQPSPARPRPTIRAPRDSELLRALGYLN